MSVELKDRLGEALMKTDLDRGQIARTVGIDPRTVSRWLNEGRKPRDPARERLLEVLAVLELLSKVLRPEPAHDWLFTPNPSLSHHKPIDLLREGRYQVVLGAIDALGEGVFA
jgi:putative toxin-antitoxin system antitoxin component (TIGR02293 family)